MSTFQLPPTLNPLIIFILQMARRVSKSMVSNSSLFIYQPNEKDHASFKGVAQSSKSSSKLKILEEQFRIKPQDCSQETKTEMIYILRNLLQYPSSKEAKQHQNANKLGKFDLISPEVEESEIGSEYDDNNKKTLCKDCGLVIQSEDLPICTKLSQFPKVGIATFLCFQNVKNLLILLLMLAAMYSGYFLYINITEPSSILSFQNFPKKLSFASTIQNLATNASLYDSMFILGWLLVGTVVLWWISLFVMKNNQIKEERMIDQAAITAADFSIMLEHVPIDYTRDDLQRDLQDYFNQLKERKQLHKMDDLKSFTIYKYCRAIPFYFLDDESIKEKLTELEEQISEKRQKIADLIEQVKENGHFHINQEARKSIYEAFKNLHNEKIKYERELVQLSKHQNYMDQKDIKTTIFVSFQHSQVANIINQINPQGFSAKMRYYLSCCENALLFKVSRQGSDVSVTRAPEPQDIIWQNIGIPDSTKVCRKILTYFITLLLLGISFGIVYGLTIMQQTYQNQVLSIAISLSITVINIILGIAIRKLTIYESDITSTNLQISLAIKSIFAQLMNSILVPIITNLYIQKNLYEVNGLVYDIFYLSITSAFLPPLLKFIDIPYLVKRVTVWYNNRTFQKLAMNQQQLNKVFQYPEFQLGVAQIYYIDLFYFTCFYVHVHPCIVLFTFIGFFLMYWAQKRSLLIHSKRPKPSSALLNDAIGKLIAFSPCVLSIGALIWFNIIREDYHNFSNLTYISHLAAIGFSAFFFLIPFNTIFNAVCYIPDDEILDYEIVKDQLTSQYSLLNPVTAEEALSQLLKIQNGGKVENKVIMIKTVKRQDQRYKETIPRQLKGSPKLDSHEDTMHQLNRQIQRRPRGNIKSNTTQQSLADVLEDVKAENEDNRFIINDFQKPRKSKPSNVTPQGEKRKSIILEKPEGYRASRQVDEGNPYKDLKF